MATPAVSVAGPSRRRVALLPTIVLGVLSAVVALAAALAARDRSQFLVVAFLGVAAISIWCLTTRRPQVALVVVALYIGLADGFIKLRANNLEATLLRDVLLYAVLANLLVRRTAPTVGRIAFPASAGLVLAFCGLVLAQTFNPNVGSVLQAVSGVRLHLEFVPLFFVGAYYCRTNDQLKTLMILLVVVGTANAIVNVIQSNLTLDQLAAWGPGYREKLFGQGFFSASARVAFVGPDSRAIVRPFGLGSDIGSGAGAAALGIPSALALSLRGRSGYLVGLYGLATVICVAGVVIGGARVVIVLGVVSLVVFLSLSTLSRQALRVVGVTAAFAAIAVVLLPVIFKGSDAGVFERLDSLAPSKVVSTNQTARGGSLAIIPQYLQSYPLGAGLGQSGNAAQFANVAKPLDAESELTFLVIETGLIGVGLVLWLNVANIIRLIAARRRIEDEARKTAVVALCAPLAGLLALWASAPTTAASPFSAYFWLALGVGSYHLAGDRDVRA